MLNRILKIILSAAVAYFFAMLLLINFLLPVILIFIIYTLFLSVRKPLIFLIIVLIIQEKIFQSHNFGIPSWAYTDSSIILLCLALIIQIIKKGVPSSLVLKNFYFKAIIVLLSIVLFCTFWGAGIINEQPIGSLIFRPRVYFLYLIFFYLFMVNFDLLQINNFLKYIFYSALIVSILVLIDAYTLGGGKIFQLAWINGVSGYRAGRVRIYTYGFCTIWSYYYLLSAIRLENVKIRKCFYFLALLIILFQIIFCIMARNLLITIFLTTLIHFFNLKHNLKVLIALLMGIFLIFNILINVNGGSHKHDMLKTLFTQTETELQSKTKGNIAVRAQGIQFYYPFFEKTAFMGMGLMSTTFTGSPVYKGGKIGYTFSDIGLFATLFRFGIPALIFIIIVLWRLFADLLWINRTTVDKNVKIISESLIYLLIGAHILFPISSSFFGEDIPLYYGIIFYIVYKMKSSLLNSTN
jgi:hypothetical protein